MNQEVLLTWDRKDPENSSEEWMMALVTVLMAVALKVGIYLWEPRPPRDDDLVFTHDPARGPQILEK